METVLKLLATDLVSGERPIIFRYSLCVGQPLPKRLEKVYIDDCGYHLCVDIVPNHCDHA